MQPLTPEELTVLKTLGTRRQAASAARLEIPSLNPIAVSDMLGELRRIGLIEADCQDDGEWFAGHLTRRGIRWLRAYGLRMTPRQAAQFDSTH